jgi:hypothetical protein
LFNSGARTQLGGQHPIAQQLDDETLIARFTTARSSGRARV